MLMHKFYYYSHAKWGLNSESFHLYEKAILFYILLFILLLVLVQNDVFEGISVSLEGIFLHVLNAV